MNKLTQFLMTLLALVAAQAWGQTDNNGNPVFNSVSTMQKQLDGSLLIGNYYTLKNNIENSRSSVFISQKPTLDQVEKAATNLPSDFFILTKESKMVVMVMLETNPKRQFKTIEMRKNQQSIFSCNLVGDITENRANEIIKEQFDPNATIENNTLKFNGKTFQIISNKEIEEAVAALIEREKLHKKKPSDITLRSQKEIKSLILEETKKDGKLDFFTKIKGEEFDGVQVKPGVFTTKQSVALYMWARACFDIGVNTVEDAYEIFSEHIGRPVNEKERANIKMGFYKEWEK